MLPSLYLLLFCNLTEKHSFHIECLSIHLHVGQSVVMAPRPIWLERGKYNMLTFLQQIREGLGVQWPQIAYCNCCFQQTWRDNHRDLGELRWKTRQGDWRAPTWHLNWPLLWHLFVLFGAWQSLFTVYFGSVEKSSLSILLNNCSVKQIHDCN